MINRWWTSDWHLNHSNILKFRNADGNPLRPFSSVEEMNEIIVENFNSLVKPGDKVYLGGDMFWGRKQKDKEDAEAFVKRLNGELHLMLGNHDDFPIDFYTSLGIIVENAWRDWGDPKEPKHFRWTHVPVHTSCLGRDKRGRQIFNVHGHTHNNIIQNNDLRPDNRYINICVERTNYKPVHIDQLYTLMNDLFTDVVGFG